MIFFSFLIEFLFCYDFPCFSMLVIAWMLLQCFPMLFRCFSIPFQWFSLHFLCFSMLFRSLTQKQIKNTKNDLFGAGCPSRWSGPSYPHTSSQLTVVSPLSKKRSLTTTPYSIAHTNGEQGSSCQAATSSAQVSCTKRLLSSHHSS